MKLLYTGESLRMGDDSIKSVCPVDSGQKRDVVEQRGMWLADSCRTREIEGAGMVELVYMTRLLRMGGESFLLHLWSRDLLEVRLLTKGIWMWGWLGQLLDGQKTFMVAGWATSHS